MVSASTILPLLHFSRLLLEVGPVFCVVPSLAGYVSEEHETLPSSIPRPCTPHSIDIRFSEDAVQIAMEILEAVEADNTSRASPGRSEQRRLCPMWYPLAIFYAALVVWGRMREDEAKNRLSHTLLPSRRVLRMFQAELEQFKDGWGCASKMAIVLNTLQR